MTTVQNALDSAATKRPDMTLWSAVEFDSMFVFAFVPKTHDPKKMPMSCLIGVDKKTGKEFYFNPASMPVEEFRRGEPIRVAKLQNG